MNPNALEFGGSLAEAQSLGMLIIDIRDPVTADQQPLGVDCLKVTTEQLLKDNSQIPADKPVLLVCYGGFSSLKLTRHLRNMGFENVYSKPGGANSA